MENLIWAVVLWAAVLLLIPFKRIRVLWPAAVIGLIWLFLVNYAMVSMDYYKFTKYLIQIGGVPLFQVIGGAAGGLLLINWLPRKPFYKIPYLLAFCVLLSISEWIYVQYTAFQYVKWDAFTSFQSSVAALAIYIWVCLSVIGEESVYHGHKTRFSTSKEGS